MVDPPWINGPGAGEGAGRGGFIIVHGGGVGNREYTDHAGYRRKKIGKLSRILTAYLEE